MREIKFRGKDILTGEWLSGNVIIEPHRVRIWTAHSEQSSTCREVNPATVGQFTGLRDKNGAEIYEGDMVQWNHEDCKDIDSNFRNWVGAQDVSVVEAVVTSYCFRIGVRDFSRNTSEYTVIGNIHDNPELVEEEGQNDG